MTVHGTLTSSVVDAGGGAGYHRIPLALLPTPACLLAQGIPMRFSRLLALPAGVAAMLLLPKAGVPVVPRSSPIEQVAWLAGCWERGSGNRIVEEQWMRPRGGTMLGMARTVRGDSTVEWEHLRIAQDGDTLVYHAMPSRQEPAAFRAISVATDAVTFEDKAHDFPQRIIYRRAPGDSLHARIEGVVRGQTRGVDFRYQRVACSS